MSKESVLEWDQIPTDFEMEDMIQQASRPGLALMKTATPDTPGANGCWLGGRPTLPPDTPWPSYTKNKFNLNIPMHFLAQINLSSLPRTAKTQHLPSDGTLFFFYDTVCAPVNHFADGGSKVIYVSGEVSHFAVRDMPKIPEVGVDWAMTHWYANNPTKGYAKWNIDFVEFCGLYSECFQNRAFQVKAATENQKTEQRMKNQMFRQARNRSDPYAKIAKEFVFHHMLGSFGPTSENGLIRLLALRDDPDLNFEHAGDWIVFQISTQDLKDQKFERTSLNEELR